MENLINDLRYGIRMLLRSPGFTAVAILALALGIGANSTIFSVVNSVLLQPLPYARPDRLMMIWETAEVTGDLQNPVAPPNFIDWRDRNQTFEDIASYVTQPVTLTGDTEPRQVEAIYSSDNLMTLLGVAPALGRIYLPGESKVEEFSSVVISHRLWQSRFGGSFDVIGMKITIDGFPLSVGGVMPAQFEFPSHDIDIWVATAATEDTSGGRNQPHYLRVLGRLKNGVTYEQALADMQSVAEGLKEQYPDTNRYVGAWVNPLHEHRFGNIRPALMLLFVVTGFVLLIACANIANLLLARATTRQKEIAIRLAIGANRWRLVRQLLTESLLLAIAGGIVGLLMAMWGVEILSSITPLNIAPADSFTIDTRVLIFTTGVSLLTGIIFGLVPAFQTTRPDLTKALKEGGRDSFSGGGWMRNTLVVAEIALALVPLIGAGLLINSFIRLSNVEIGFNSNNLLTMEAFPPYAKYPDTPRRSAFYDQVIERTEALPGVTSAAFITSLPMTGNLSEMTYIIEQPAKHAVVPAVPRTISPKYFQTIGIPLIAGRAFNAQDTSESELVAIIDEVMARRLWPDENPIGKRMKMGLQTSPWLTIVGLVKESRLDIQQEPLAQVYMPYSQLAAFGPEHLVLRTTTDPASLSASVKNAIWEVDKDQAVSNISSMDAIVSESLSRQRFNMTLLALFAALAVALAGVGIYGVMSYAVTQSRRDIGIRMALGAQSTDVMKLVLSKGFALSITGVGLGIAGAFALTRLMSSLLYEIVSYRHDDLCSYVITACGSGDERLLYTCASSDKS